MKLFSFSGTVAVCYLLFFCSHAAAKTYEGGTTVLTNDLSQLTVGGTVPNTIVIVTNGAVVQVDKAVMLGRTSSSSNNQLTVASGSALTAGTVSTGTVATIGTGGIFVGANGSISINNASSVTAEYFYTGLDSNQSSTITVSSIGTALNVTKDTYIGGYADSGSGNTVTIEGGAALYTDTITVGTLGNSNNTVTVSSGGILSVSSDSSISVVNNSSQTNNYNAITIEDAGILQITGDVNYSTITNRHITLETGATLEVGGTLTDSDMTIDDGVTYRLNNSISTNTATWDTGSDDITIGSTGCYNALEIVEGTVQAVDGTVYIGQAYSADRNSLTVSNETSKLIVSQNIIVGVNGSSNIFNVVDGASAEISGIVRIGDGIGSGQNAVSVSGSNSTLTVSDTVTVGYNGSGSSLTVSDIGSLAVGSSLTVGVTGDNNKFSILSGGVAQISGNLIIGENSDGNSVLVKGSANSNTVLTVYQDLIVGNTGGDNLFEVGSNSTVTISGDVTVGVSTGKNAVAISGTNSIVEVGGNFTVGAAGGNSKLDISDQGNLSISSDMLIGAGTSSNNTVLIFGTNSALSVAGDTYVGESGSGNRLTVSNAAEVLTENLYVGYTAGSSNNCVLVTGEDALLSVSGSIYLGADGTTNMTIAVAAGGKLFIGGDVIAGTGSNNVININNAGSLEVIDWNFTTASTNILFNSGSTLGVGGTFANTTNSVDLGDFTLALDGSISTNDTAVWDASTNTITVGETSSANVLAAIDGGLILAESIIVGSQSSSKGNQLLVEGTNALLSVSGSVTVGGNSSSGNLFAVNRLAEAVIGTDLIVGNYSDSNQVEVGDTGSTNVYETSYLTVSNNLVIGINGGAGNSLTIYTNGSVSVLGDAIVGTSSDGNNLIVNGSNGVLDVSGDLIIGTGKSASNSFEIYYGTVNALSDLILGASTNSTKNDLVVSGSNAVLNAYGDLIVGNAGGKNSASITAGAIVNAYSNLYVGMAGMGNWIYVSDTNSVLNISGNLIIGQQKQGGNQLGVFDGGYMSVNGDLTLAGTNSLLQVDSLSSVWIGGNYTQDANAVLRVGLNTNEANIQVDGTAEFASGGSGGIYVDTTGYDTTAVGITTNVQASIIQASGGLLYNGTDMTLSALSTLNTDFSDLDALFINSLKDFDAYITNNNTIVIDNYTELPISSTLGLSGSAATVGSMIDDWYSSGDKLSESMRNILDALSSADAKNTMLDYYGEMESSMPIHNVINDAIGGFSSRLSARQNDVRVRLGLSSGAARRDPTKSSLISTNDLGTLQGWMQGFGSWASRDKDGGFRAYDASTYGTVMGFDFQLAETLLVGVAGGYSTSTVDKAGGATAEATSKYGALYMTLVNDLLFYDMSALFGVSTIDTTLGNVFDTEGSYDAKNLAVSLNIGREIVGDYVVITPQAGVLINYYAQDSYTETSTNAYGRTVDSFDALYIQSRLGCSLGMYTTLGNLIVRPEIRAFWLHEFNGANEDIYYTIANDPQQMTLTMQAPETDILQLGAGFTLDFSDRVTFTLGADMGSSTGKTQYTLTGKLCIRL